MLIYLLLLFLAAFARGDFLSTDYDEYNKGTLGRRPHIEFHSSKEFSPMLQVNVWNKSAISQSGSHIFLRHDGNRTYPHSSPLVLDAEDLSVVYMNRSFENVFNTRIQEDSGKKYLTFWEGKKRGGFGDGYGLAFDDTYRLVYKIWAQGIAAHTDLHEFQFTGEGTALVTGIDKISADTSDWDGWEGEEQHSLLDAVFQEIALETNEVLFNWRASEHIDPMDSYEPVGVDWDAFHLNSIQKTKAGNYLISLRHIHSVVLVDGETGDIIWRLGGKKNDFTELPPARGTDPQALLLTMAWQHHARYVDGSNETQMTFFDNHIKVTTHEQCTTDCSRGVHIAIDEKARTVKLLREYIHPSRLQAQSQGSVQPLSPEDEDIGNIFIGWGRCPSFTEHTASGETVLDVQFSPWHSSQNPEALDNYRAFKMDWKATPWWDPVAAWRKTPTGRLIAFVSWNGATEVREWVIRGGSEAKSGDVLAKSSRMGFETRLSTTDTDVQYVWAEALDRKGVVIRSTEVLALNMTELSVVVEIAEDTEDDDDDDEDDDENSSGLPTIMWVLLGIGLGTGFLTTVAGILIWRRRNVYHRLEGENPDMGLAPGPDRDVALDRDVEAHLVSDDVIGDDTDSETDDDESVDETKRLKKEDQ